MIDDLLVIATTYNNDEIVVFLSYSVFNKLHYLKKPWRNLETFDSSL